MGPISNGIETAARPWLVNSLYRRLMRLTRRRAMISLGKINARLFPRGEVVQLPHGALLYCPPDPHFFGFVLGTHDPHISDLLGQLVVPGSVCVDVGANIGYFSVIMARLCGSNGEVWSYEPVSENYQVFCQNVSLANGANQIIRPIHAAVSDNEQALRIIRKGFSTLHEVGALEEGASTDADCVESVTLEGEYRSKIRREISVLKVDVEGHEWPVIRGCESLIAERVVRHIIIEVTPSPEARLIQEVFERHGVRYMCWVHNEWRRMALSELTYRTDAWGDCV
jgi:FkbM family methyltransferase